MEYHRNENVDIRIARIFNTYGPRLNKSDGRVISNFIVAALKNEPMTIYGQGKQTRSFCFVQDQIRGLIKLMNSNYNLPINIGNPHEITIKQAAEIIKKLIPESNSVIQYRDLPSDDPMQRKPDITKAQTILGWNPTVDLQDGLLETIQYFKNHLATNN
jgi:UDP-glucuronate decarboxylase